LLEWYRSEFCFILGALKLLMMSLRRGGFSHLAFSGNSGSFELLVR
jgi:hypothetical protein